MRRTELTGPAGRCRAGAYAGLPGGLAARMLSGVLAAAILVGGGLALGGCSADGQEAAAPSPSETAAPESAAPEPTPPAPVVLDTAYVGQLPYTGGAAQCALTPEQAEAFAQIIEEAAGESQSLYGKPELKQYALCQVALFDAGNGIPALLVAEGYYYDYGIREITRQDYQFYKGEVYYWDGSQAVALLDSQPQYLVLTDRGLEVSYAYSDYTETYPLSDGRISAEPAERYISFRLVGDTQPTEADLQTEIAAYENLDMSFDFTTLTGDKWSQETVWDKYDQENVTYWRIAASDGAFIRYSDDTRPAHRLSPDNWLVGVGLDIFSGKNNVSFRWEGSWGDGAQTAAVLREGAQAARAERQPESEPPQSAGEAPAQVPVPRIQRIDWDQPINNMEVYFEMPVFDNASGGYQVINQFFQQKQEAFFSPDNPSLARAQEWDSPENHIPPNEIYTYCYTVQIKDCTDQLFSATLSSSWYMGGQYDAGTDAYTFRVDTGELLGLDDLLEGSEAEIKEMVAEAAVQEYGVGTAAVETICSDTLDQFQFYVSEGHIFVCFDKYELPEVGPAVLDVELTAQLKPLS